jgi:hypothetical protein
MDSQRCWPEVGFAEVKNLFTFYPREHRSPARSYGLSWELQSAHDGARFFEEVASLMFPFPRG